MGSLFDAFRYAASRIIRVNVFEIYDLTRKTLDVLDVACGEALDENTLVETHKVHKVIGFDTSSEKIELAQKYASKGITSNYFVGDFMDEPFPAHASLSFDFVNMQYCAQHFMKNVSSVQAWIKWLAAITRRHGRIAISFLDWDLLVSKLAYPATATATASATKQTEKVKEWRNEACSIVMLPESKQTGTWHRYHFQLSTDIASHTTTNGMDHDHTVVDKKWLTTQFESIHKLKTKSNPNLVPNPIFKLKETVSFQKIKPPCKMSTAETELFHMYTCYIFERL